MYKRQVALGLGKGVGVLCHLVVKGHLVAQTLHVGVVLAGLHLSLIHILLIGATVVSIGTTLPEVMVSTTSALTGHGEIALSLIHI